MKYSRTLFWLKTTTTMQQPTQKRTIFFFQSFFGLFDGTKHLVVIVSSCQSSTNPSRYNTRIIIDVAHHHISQFCRPFLKSQGFPHSSTPPTSTSPPHCRKLLTCPAKPNGKMHWFKYVWLISTFLFFFSLRFFFCLCVLMLKSPAWCPTTLAYPR